MELAEEFRTRAQRCLKLAHEAPTLESQTHWLAMAQLWFNLAQHAEERDGASLGETGLRPEAGRHQNGRSGGNGESEQETGNG